MPMNGWDEDRMLAFFAPTDEERDRHYAEEVDRMYNQYREEHPWEFRGLTEQPERERE